VLLLQILAATLLTGVGSVWLAAWLMRVGLPRAEGLDSQHLLSLAAGALLATAFMHLLPEAFDGRQSPQLLFAVLLAGLVFFFLLDKAELWHHGHEHHHARADPDHTHHDHRSAGGGGWAVLMGDSLHGFGDGILMASAFAAGPSLGVIAALAVLTHEVPHHIGDLVVIHQSSGTPRAALLKVSMAGAVTGLGGLVGYWLLGHLHAALPFFLVVASSSFVYVALADLIPQLQRRLSMGRTLQQIVWLLGGMGLVALASSLTRGI